MSKSKRFELKSISTICGGEIKYFLNTNKLKMRNITK